MKGGKPWVQNIFASYLKSECDYALWTIRCSSHLWYRLHYSFHQIHDNVKVFFNTVGFCLLTAYVSWCGTWIVHSKEAGILNVNWLQRWISWKYSGNDKSHTVANIALTFSSFYPFISLSFLILIISEQ